MFKVFPFTNVNILRLEWIVIQPHTKVLSKERLFPGVWFFLAVRWSSFQAGVDCVVLEFATRPRHLSTIQSFNMLLRMHTSAFPCFGTDQLGCSCKVRKEKTFECVEELYGANI